MQPTEVIVLIQMQTLPDASGQARQDLLDLAKLVRDAESDCLAIELAQDIDDPTKITMIEKWTSREAYEGPHMQTAHMQAFIDKSAGLFAGPPAISFHKGTVA